MVWQAPVQGGRKGREDGVSPIIGTMFVFVIIVMGMAGALVFGVPSIQGIQDRATLGDMASQLEQVREEAEKLTVEGAGAGMVLAPSAGTVQLVNGTKMGVSISYDNLATQQGLNLHTGKGQKAKKNMDVAPADQHPCDFHLQDWADGDAVVTINATNCQTPAAWAPGTELLPSGVEPEGDWEDDTLAKLLASDDAFTYTQRNNPADLRVELEDPTGSGPLTAVTVWAEVSITDAADDGFQLKACLGASPCSNLSTNHVSGATDASICLALTSKPGGGAWEVEDLADLEIVVDPTRDSGRDGTWRVDRVWAQYSTSEPATSCCVDVDLACLQAYRISDPTYTDQIESVTAIGNDQYSVALAAPVTGDWYFQLSNDPNTASANSLLAKAYLFEMQQLRWVRDEGLAAWLEGGAVFGTRLDTQYVISQPIVDEDFRERPDCAPSDSDESCQPTYYLRIIRFQGEAISLQAGGNGMDVHLRHVATQATANDGVSILRLDFHGEGSELWCNAIMARDTPEGYDYFEDPAYPCDGSTGEEVRSLGYVYHDAALSCPVDNPDPDKYAKWPSANAKNRENHKSCLQYKADQETRRFYSIVFAEVHFDVKLRP